jgi:hypothetical protein
MNQSVSHAKIGIILRIGLRYLKSPGIGIPLVVPLNDIWRFDCLALGRDGLGHLDFSFFGLPPSFPFSAEDLAFASDLRDPRFLASVLAVMVLPQWGHFMRVTPRTRIPREAVAPPR